MTFAQETELIGWVNLVIIIPLPIVLYWCARRWMAPGGVPRLLYVVALVWLVRNIFRFTVGAANDREWGRLHNDWQCDGVGGNAVTLFMGWFEPLLICLLYLGVVALMRRLRLIPAAPMPAPRLRDVDQIIARLTAEIPGVRIKQLQVTHSADDDGLWFIRIAGRPTEVQIESSEGTCPFVIESDQTSERVHGSTIDEVVAIVKRLLV